MSAHARGSVTASCEEMAPVAELKIVRPWTLSAKLMSCRTVAQSSSAQNWPPSLKPKEVSRLRRPSAMNVFASAPPEKS